MVELNFKRIVVLAQNGAISEKEFREELTKANREELEKYILDQVIIAEDEDDGY